MSIKYESTYPVAKEQLLLVWSNPEFLRYKFALLNQDTLFVKAFTSEKTKPKENEQAKVVKTDIISIYRAHVVPPGVLRLLIPKFKFEQSDNWEYDHDRDELRASWKIDIKGFPAIMWGTLSLDDIGSDGSKFSVATNVTPAIHNKTFEKFLYRLAALSIKRTLDQVHSISLEWLEHQGRASDVKVSTGQNKKIKNYGLTS